MGNSPSCSFLFSFLWFLVGRFCRPPPPSPLTPALPPLPHVSSQVGLRLLDALPRLAKAEPAITRAAARARFISDGGGGGGREAQASLATGARDDGGVRDGGGGGLRLRRADELYDPTDRQLLALLSEDCFPDRAHSTPQVPPSPVPTPL